MKLGVEIEGTRSEIILRREGARVFAEIEDRHYELEAHEVEPNVYLLLVGGAVYECRVDAGASQRRTLLDVYLKDRVYSAAISDPKQLRGARGAVADADGRAEVRAPMPGKVVRVLVERGASVEAGDGLVVVEAMKMQNELKSPKAGAVVELHAEPGATVNAGDVLVVVE